MRAIWRGKIPARTSISSPTRPLDERGARRGARNLPEVLPWPQLGVSFSCATNADWAQRWHQRLLTPWTTA
jgi:hypothetical protein